MSAYFPFRPMLRRALAYFVLAFALLFVQQGGAAHELSHFARGSHPDKQLPHSKACDQCAAYAQMADGMVSHACLPPLQARAGERIVFLGVAYATPSCFSHPSRAPPAHA